MAGEVRLITGNQQESFRMEAGVKELFGAHCCFMRSLEMILRCMPPYKCQEKDKLTIFVFVLWMFTNPFLTCSK